MTRTFLCILLSVLFFIPPSLCTVSAADELSVSARSAVLMCADDGGVIFKKNSRLKMPMASTTKIMTCLVALEKGDLSDTVEVSPLAVGVEGSSVYLQKGDSASLSDLLYAVMLRSANDAAAAVAVHIGGSIEAFAEMMNEKAAEIGMKDTHFTNPHGLHDEDHYTTAYDFALLGCYAIKNESFAKIVSTKEYTVSLNGDSLKKPIVNHNKLLRIYEGANGIKTGFTKTSGRCLVSSATRDGVTLVAVTFNAPSDWADHAAMLDCGFSKYYRASVMEKGSLKRCFDVAGFGTVEAANTEEVSVVLRKDSDIAVSVHGQRLFFAPVLKGQTMAEAVVTVDGAEYCRVPLVALTDVLAEPEETGFSKFLGKLFKSEK